MKSVVANRLPREKFLRGAPVMDLLGFGGIVRRVLFICVLVCFMAGLVAGNVVLIGKNVSLSFDDIEATFAPPIKGSGECGALYIAEPLDACTPLKNKVAEGPNSPFVLIKRGECTFDDKVRSAQRAGFKAAIVYDNEDSGVLVAMTPASRMSISMMPASLVPTRKRVFLENKLGCGKLAVAGSSNGIHIHAVFVSKASGESLKKYAGRTDVELWIIPTVENSAWSIMAISFISLLAMSAVLATCFFVRRHRIRRERPRVPNIREFHGMSSRLVKAIPSLIFTSVLEDNSTSRTCAICLEDYTVGEKLRVLPCRHKFHALCVDAWLTTWRTFCPVCKQDVRTSTCNPPASEYTPLLSAAPSRSSSTSALSSFHSSVSASPSLAIPILRTPPQSPLNSRTHSLSSFPHVSNPHRSYSNSPAVSISRNSFNLRNSSSHRSLHSFGLSSPMNSRYMMSPYVPSPSNGSPSYLVASSGRQSYLRRCGESGASLSAQASDHSLPGCG